MNCPHGCCSVAVIMKKCGNHEIFITKIFNYGIFSNFTKILNHENLELYGIQYFRDCPASFGTVGNYASMQNVANDLI